MPGYGACRLAVQCREKVENFLEHCFGLCESPLTCIDIAQQCQNIHYSLRRAGLSGQNKSIVEHLALLDGLPQLPKVPSQVAECVAGCCRVIERPKKRYAFLVGGQNSLRTFFKAI